MVSDPLALPRARQVFGNQLIYAETAASCVQQADGVVITIPCEEFRALTALDFSSRSQPIVVLDCWRLLRETLQHAPQVVYLPVGVDQSEKSAPTQVERCISVS